MKTLIVKNWLGEYEVETLYNATEAQVRQILEQINPDIQAILGDYTWIIEQAPIAKNKKGENIWGYQIVACWGGQHWVESRGKSPRIAVANHRVIRRILEEQYGVEVEV